LIPALARVYFIAKAIYENSSFNTPRSHFICKLQGVEDQFTFYLKSLLKKQTLNTSLIAIGILIICSGVSLRVHERGAAESALDEVWNGFWVISVTLTSVGYGDIAPVTHIGRAVCMFSALIGVFLTSYVVLAVENLTNIEDDYENSLYSYIKYKIMVRKKVKPVSILLI